MSALSLAAFAGLAHGQAFSEGFEGGLPATWTVHNQSNPIGTTQWGSGSSAAIPPHGGAVSMYANYLNGAGLATISDWLISPQLATLSNGDTINFWTRTTDGTYPDRMQLRVSLAGASTNTGTTEFDVGDFTTLVLDINPGYSPTGYPTVWTQMSQNLSGIATPTSGRFAFRYFVEGGGPSGNNSDLISVDDVDYLPAGGPPVGACCLPQAVCSTLTAASCTAQGGTWNGAGTLCANVVCPGQYVESGDAGDLPNTAAVPTGSGPLYRIQGTMGSNDVDMFLISICDVANFSATSATTVDTQLFLFTAGGTGVVFNDETATSSQAVLTNALVTSNGNYYLAIDAYNADANSSGGAIFPDSWPGEFGPTGPGGGSPVTGWSGTAFGSGAYTINLTGTCYPNLNATGACCTSGSCTVGTASACLSGGGVYQGDNSTCASVTCPQPGSCCKVDGTCGQMLQSACNAQSGIFGGQGNPCSGNCSNSYVYNGAPVAIPDGTGSTQCGATVYAEIVVTDSFTIAGADASVFIPHTYQGDVSFSLTHVETSTTVSLVDRPGVPAATYGFSSANYGTPSVPFRSTDAGANIYDEPAVTTPGLANVTGTWRPESPLSAFNGQNSAGHWQLTAKDCGGGDTGSITSFVLNLRPGATACYANCDGSTTPPVANVGDFTCFLQKFAALDPYANCDGSTTPPTINVGDFTCFLQKFAAGCP